MDGTGWDIRQRCAIAFGACIAWTDPDPKPNRLQGKGTGTNPSPNTCIALANARVICGKQPTN